MASITLAQMVLRGWAAAGGWFYWDDFWWHDIVARTSLSDAVGLSLGGHYSPFTYLPYYLLTAAFPYEWASRVVVMLGTLLVINVGVLAVARRMWPGRGPQLAAYTLWAFSSLVAPSWLWFSQFSMTGALLMTSTWTLWAYLRALSSSGPAPQVLAVALLVVSLFSQERMIVMTLLLVGVLVLVCKPTMPQLRFRPRPGLWLSSGLAILVWLLVYTSLPSAEIPAASPQQGAGIAVAMVRTSGLPALLGGPWVLNAEPVLRRADTPIQLQVATVVIIASLITWTVRRSRKAVWAWVVLGVGLISDAVLVVIGRGGTLGEGAIPEWRYFSGLAVLGPLMIVAAFVSPGTRSVFSRLERRVLYGLIVVYVVSSLLTTIQLGLAWHQSTSRPYVQKALVELRNAGPRVVLDRFLPESVVNRALMAQRRASHVFSIAETEAVFDVPTAAPLWLDDNGRLVPGALKAQRRSTGVGECPYRIGGTTTTWIPLVGQRNIAEWGLEIEYESQRPVRAGVTDGPSTVDVELQSGRGSLFVNLASAPKVGVFLADPSQTICVRSVISGKPGPR